jgi:hypothetical protein
MNTIGVADKGELNPEMLKIVQQEVANIIAKEGLDKYKANNNNMYTWTTYTSDGKEENIIHAEDVAKIIGKQDLYNYNADKKRKDTDKTQAMQDIVDEEAVYEQGWIDCSKIVTVYLNSWFKMKGIDAQAVIDPEVNEIVIVDECRRSF